MAAIEDLLHRRTDLSTFLVHLTRDGPQGTARENLSGRAVQFEPYGFAITKSTARKTGCNPVWYSDITVRGRTWPIKTVNLMIDSAVRRARTRNGRIDPKSLAADPIFQITPYFEQMGPTNNGRRKEFWWEREWRHLGGYWINIPRIVSVLAPADDHERLRNELVDIDDAWGDRPLIDPRWGLERTIVALAGLSKGDSTLFPDPD
jgi:hypothetical protein